MREHSEHTCRIAIAKSGAIAFGVKKDERAGANGAIAERRKNIDRQPHPHWTPINYTLDHGSHVGSQHAFLIDQPLKANTSPMNTRSDAPHTSIEMPTDEEHKCHDLVHEPPSQTQTTQLQRWKEHGDQILDDSLLAFLLYLIAFATG